MEEILGRCDESSAVVGFVAGQVFICLITTLMQMLCIENSSNFTYTP